MKYIYEFHGGRLSGKRLNRHAVEEISAGHTPDNSLKRSQGVLCGRVELDKQPKVDGYLGPMYDGIRHVLKNGKEKYDFERFDRAQVVRSFAVLRYETQEVYNAMCN